MEEMSGKVQNANTHILRRHIHEHAHSSRSVQGPVQGGAGCWFKESSKCKRPLHISAHTQARHKVNSAGRWNVTHGFDSRQSSPPAKAHAEQNSQYFSGAMETSQKVQKANTQMTLPRSRTRWCWSALPGPQWRVPRPAGRESKISLHWGDG